MKYKLFTGAALVAAALILNALEPVAAAAKTSFTSGVHAGYYAHPKVSLSGDLRCQRGLSTPAAVKAAPETRDAAQLQYCAD